MSAVIVIVAVPAVAPAAIVIGLVMIEWSAAVAVPVTVNGTVTLDPEVAESCAVTVMLPDSFVEVWLAEVQATDGVVSSSVIVTV